MDCIVIRTGKYFNYTYASTRWGTWGDPTGYEILVCDQWEDGFRQARELGKKMVLFLDSGTVFNDINGFIDSIKFYPHQGLIGHIIDPLDPDKFYALHPQCFLMDVQQFDPDIFENSQYQAPAVERSKLNIHDGYTPLWLKPVPGSTRTMVQQDFGQKILAQHLTNGKMVSNWHQKLRNNKIYLYRDEIRDDWIQSQDSYLDLAEQHLWILNNQSMPKMSAKHLISPASGVFWMAAIEAETIELVDISYPQINLAQDLLRHWDGKDYGSFVRDFIIKHKIKHLQFDTTMEQSDKISLLADESHFREYVNDRFQEQLWSLGTDVAQFEQHWTVMRYKKISLHRADIVDHLLSSNLGSDHGIWLSNILDYKYTWVKSTAEKIQSCQERLLTLGCQVQS